MKTITGDLIKLALEGQFDVIVHGCNCHHIMGAGIAKQIAETFPSAKYADLLTKKSSDKFGGISVARDKGVIIVNAYTQIYPGTPGITYDKEKDRLKAITLCFKVIEHQFGDLRIGYPKIGAGLAGGNWENIYPIIYGQLRNLDHTLVILP